MRRGEVLRLDRDDVDLRRGLITIRNSKFYKSRMVVCHDSTRQVLRGYAVRRDDLWPHPQSPAFFLSDLGTRVGRSMLNTTFAKLTRTTGLRGSGDSRGPRLHDMRHTFAVRTLLQWYGDDVDIDRWLPRLSTWLGHGSVGDTYWYLTAVPELMEQAARRLDRVHGRLSP